MIKDGRVSLKSMRKIANTAGQFIPAFALIGFSFINSDHRTLAVGMLIIAVGCNVAVFNGHQMSHMDLSPNFSGILMGITNATANVFGIMAPLICGAIVSDIVRKNKKIYI